MPDDEFEFLKIELCSILDENSGNLNYLLDLAKDLEFYDLKCSELLKNEIQSLTKKDIIEADIFNSLPLIVNSISETDKS